MNKLTIVCIVLALCGCHKAPVPEKPPTEDELAAIRYAEEIAYAKDCLCGLRECYDKRLKQKQAQYTTAVAKAALIKKLAAEDEAQAMAYANRGCESEECIKLRVAGWYAQKAKRKAEAEQKRKDDYKAYKEGRRCGCMRPACYKIREAMWHVQNRQRRAAEAAEAKARARSREAWLKTWRGKFVTWRGLNDWQAGFTTGVLMIGLVVYYRRLYLKERT